MISISFSLYSAFDVYSAHPLFKGSMEMNFTCDLGFKGYFNSADLLCDILWLGWV